MDDDAMDKTAADEAAAGRMRLDKWLWHARVVRTRVLAQQLALSGHVRINGRRAESAARPVKAGDVLTIALPGCVRVLKVLNFAERRGSASETAGLFEELSDPSRRSTT
jgi:ribosome-associated heat shock protein Hsp15